MLVLKSSYLDCGVKNYKKNRLIVDPVHFKNELIYNMESTGKTSFNVSAISYRYPKRLSLKNFFNSFEGSDVKRPFNFFLNRNGNLITNVELSDKTFFYPDENDTINIVFCLSTESVIEDNNQNPGLYYRPQQIKTLMMCLSTIINTGENVNIKSIDVGNVTETVQSLGFNLSELRRV